MPDETPQPVIYTIGHSTRTLEDFIHLLHLNKIELLVDVRHFPGSRKFPHFDKEALQTELPKKHINYTHLVDLGGRRKPSPTSTNTAWRLPAFKGYADYMETEAFKSAAKQLSQLALQQPTAYMCSEAVWWSCHRSLLSDYFKVRGWKVLHIMDSSVPKEHPYTKPARIVDGSLVYSEPPHI